jgi:hypothetical protein
MKHLNLFIGTTILIAFTGSAVAGHPGEAFSSNASTPVGPVTTTITQVNYDESGGTINGFLAGNFLLVFSKSVCGGIGSLGAAGNTVTFSGTTRSTTGIEVVNVTSFTNGPVTYPTVVTPTKPSVYAATAGTITKLNYNAENGEINGFLFTPITGAKVFVDSGNAKATVVALLKVGAAVTVTGLQEAPGVCAATGTILEVDASSLTIGGTAYPLGGVR